MTLAQTIALWADQLRDMSAMGLRFSTNLYDRENYHALQDMAIEMLAVTTGALPDEIEPLRSTMLTRPTPLCTGDAAIIDKAGRILLIRRADNGLWAMPGGALAVGETPARGVVREAWEETGVRCEAVAFVGIHDSRLCGTTAPHHLYQFLFLCRPLEDGRAEPASHAIEVLETAWFGEGELPATLDPGHITRISEAYRVWRGDPRPYWDR